MPGQRIVIGTRASALALWQARQVRDALRAALPAVTVALRAISTAGDRATQPLQAIGGKGLFLRDIERALTAGDIDLAAHSAKDMPAELPPGLALGAVCKRADARDAFVSNRYAGIADMPPGAVVGTCSLRRQSQLAARFPHLKFAPLRGNIDTRLAKLDAGDGGLSRHPRSPLSGGGDGDGDGAGVADGADVADGGIHPRHPRSLLSGGGGDGGGGGDSDSVADGGIHPRHPRSLLSGGGAGEGVADGAGDGTTTPTGKIDAIILAVAGLRRLGLERRMREILPLDLCLPAAGQGAIGVECRADDARLPDWFAALNHRATAACVTAERAVVSGLGGDCHLPIAAFAEAAGEQLSVRAQVGSVDGKQILRARRTGSITCAQSLGIETARELLEHGAAAIIAATRRDHHP